MDRHAIELTATALAAGLPAMQIIEAAMGRFVHETVPNVLSMSADELRQIIATATCADDDADFDPVPQTAAGTAAA
jgi:hypothetical protein